MYKQGNNQNIIYWLHARQIGYQTRFFNESFIAEKVKEYEYLHSRFNALRRGQSHAALSLGEYYLGQQIEPNDEHSMAAIHFLLKGVKLGNTMCLDALVAMCEASDSTLPNLKKKLTSLPPKMVIEIHYFISTHSIQTMNQIITMLIEFAENNTDLISPETFTAIHKKMQYLSTLSHLSRDTVEAIKIFIEKNECLNINQLTINS